MYFTFTWTVDPYGVSPVNASWPSINEFKPKRRNIDRLIKPYEVWRHQPRTVFIGSSRILESIDPAVLDGSRFAPAYNASVPANMLSFDAAQLAQYIELDRNLKYVFVELFFWNFIYQQPAQPKHTFASFMENSWPLHLSGQTLWDSVITLNANMAGKQRTPYVGPRGNWRNLPGHNAKPPFDIYVESIVRIHRNLSKVELQPTAFQALDRIAEICRRSGVELYFLMMPNHPYDDYRIRSLGYWSLLEQWHRSLATYPNVLGASQYTGPLTEPISERMLYWNDPIHPSAKFGELVLRAFLGDRASDIPPDILLPVNKDTVEVVLQKRRSGLDHWTAENPGFAAKFDQEKLAAHLERPRLQ